MDLKVLHLKSYKESTNIEALRMVCYTQQFQKRKKEEMH
jgi:hypothetical protein